MKMYDISTILMVYNVAIHPNAIDDIEADATLTPQILAQQWRPKKVQIQNRSLRCRAHGHNIRTCKRRE
jgi:hypothetical protein